MGCWVLLNDSTEQYEVADLCAALHKAVRAVRFYPPGHPLATGALAALADNFGHQLSGPGLLELEVTERGFVHDDALMDEREDLRDSIPFLLFRDGVRTLVFSPGLTTDEIHALVSVFAQAPDLDRADRDITTVLWDQDLVHVECRVVDPLLDREAGTTTLERLRASLRDGWDTVLGERAAWSQVPATALSEAAERAVAPDGSLADLLEADARIGDLVGAEERARLSAEMAAEPDVFDELVVVLTEVLASAKREDDLAAAAKALSDVLCSYMDWGELTSLLSSIERLDQMQQQVPQRADTFIAILDGLTDPERVARLIGKLDGPLMTRRSEAEGILLRLRERVCGTLLDLLVEVDGRAARRCLLNVLAADGGVPAALIVPRLADSRWYVVRNMVLLLGVIGDPSAIMFLEKTLDHDDERVRSETVRSLSHVGGPRAAYLITSALNDPSSLVRTVAARTLTSLSGPDAVVHLLRQVGTRDFGSRSETERDAVFESLGRLGDDRAVPALDALWATRSLFRNRTLSVRLQALRTLKNIGTPKARESLARAVGSGDETIRRQAKHCLLETEHRTANE
jgi:HEAT repeat protein